MAIKKAVAVKKAIARTKKGGPPVLRLASVGKIKRADIRKAVREVRDEKAKALSANGEV